MLGELSGVEHEIRLTKGVEPHRESYRRLHPHKRECADRQIQEFLDKGFISPSQSPFSLGVVMIKKPDGTYRMSVDFRKLNAMTEKESYPLPKLEETLGKLSETKYYSNAGYEQGNLADSTERRIEGTHGLRDASWPVSLELLARRTVQRQSHFPAPDEQGTR